ncbi:MAG: class I SAM-dependent methyltransferase [Bacillota bacterium]
MDTKRVLELKDKVRESYRLSAKHFTATRKKGLADDFLWAAGQIGENDRILDAGCGSGRLLEAVEIGPERYVGIDGSELLLGYAREIYPGYRFEQGELEDLEIKDEFDCIFCSAVISHIPGRENRTLVLKAFLNAAKDGGKLVISVWKFRGKYRRLLHLARIKSLLGLNPYGWNEIVFDWKSDDGRPLAKRYYHYFSKRAFLREIAASGWLVKELHDSAYNYWAVAEKKES